MQKYKVSDPSITGPAIAGPSTGGPLKNPSTASVTNRGGFCSSGAATSSLPRDPAVAAPLWPLESALRSSAPLLKTKVSIYISQTSGFRIWGFQEGEGASGSGRIGGGVVVEGQPNPVGKISRRVTDFDLAHLCPNFQGSLRK